MENEYLAVSQNRVPKKPYRDPIIGKRKHRPIHLQFVRLYFLTHSHFDINDVFRIETWWASRGDDDTSTSGIQ